MSCDEISEPIKFETVLASEKQTIAAQRSPAENGEMQLAGLAFSGGGIRSAVINLGFIQGLANRNCLHMFDYLSTVSGGGYIGGWLSALLHRRFPGKPAGEVEMQALQQETLKTPPSGGKPDATGFAEAEDKSVRFLRRYSNYLTPRMGLTGDTLSLAALMVRNVAVIQLLLISMFVTGFTGLLLMRWLSIAVNGATPHLKAVSVTIAVLLAYALYSALKLQKQWGDAKIADRNPSNSVTFKVLVPALTSGIFAAAALHNVAPVDWAVRGAAAAVVCYIVAWGFATKPDCNKAWAGIIGGALTLGVLLYTLLTLHVTQHALKFAPLAAMAIFSLVITVHLALAGSIVTEQNREWWARLSGQGTFIALGWALAFLFLQYAPPLMQYGMDQAAHWLIAGGGLWATLTGFGAKLAQSKDTGEKGNAWKNILILVAPWVFLAGLLGMVAWGFVKCLPGITLGEGALSDLIEIYDGQLNNQEWTTLLPIALISGLLFRVLLKYVDLNLFSAHSFYRNRLARAFLGASQDLRHPNPYSGFDPKDDLPLSKLAGQRPIHLVNTTLNMTGGEDMAWQTRRGACFTFTPSHTGYSTRDSNGREFGGFRPTAEYGGGDITLATAVAVSGAAASPNMGFHTASSIAALLTALNLRLARWCPNPTKNEWDHSTPKNSAAPLFAELFGDAGGKKAWINLSDGGHFENLGIYELIRRRAALIIATDAGADGDYRFDDLAMAVRKIQVDFGVHVEIIEPDLGEIRPKAAERCTPQFSRKQWAYGRIHYPEGIFGYLIYVKSSITDSLPIDIRQYRDAHPAFPHESTADQWFDEDQFEAYRHLGQIIAENLLDELPVKNGTGQSAKEIINELYRGAESYFAKLDAKPIQGKTS